MHNLDVVFNVKNSTDTFNVQFHKQQQQQQKNTEQLLLADLIRLKIKNREFFYGIEVAAKSLKNLNYQHFDCILPLFTSLVWFGLDYSDVKKIENVDTIRLGQIIQSNAIVMPHFTCYQTDRQRLENFLELNFSNILVLRGEEVSSNQEYLFASDLVAEIRRLRGESISIGVAGYPEGHPDSISIENDMKFLVQKVKSGADFIITQHCFSSEKIVDFVKNCRQNGITIPIIVGILIPENFQHLQRICKILRIQISKNDFQNYSSFQLNETNFLNFATHSTVKMIEKIIQENIGIFGFHFFTMNKFESTQIVIQELTKVFNKKKEELQINFL